MKVSLKEDGGFGFFPGLNSNKNNIIQVETEDLPDEERTSLEDHINEALTHKEESAKPDLRRSADVKKYTITIEKETKKKELVFTDAEMSTQFSALVKQIKNCSKK